MLRFTTRSWPCAIAAFLLLGGSASFAMKPLPRRAPLPSVVPVGAMVLDVASDSPNRRSGLRKGDVITHVAGVRVTTYPAYRQAVEKAAARGPTIPLTVRASQAKAEGPPRSVSVRHSNSSGRVTLGVRLRFLEPGLWLHPSAPAAAGALRPGDLITHIDGRPVAGTSGVLTVIMALRSDRGATLTVRPAANRAGSTRTVRLQRGDPFPTTSIVPVRVDTAEGAGGTAGDDGAGSRRCVRSLFLLTDDDPRIGETVRADYQLLSGLFQQQLRPAERAPRIVLRGSQGQLRSRDMILREIRDLVGKVGPDDTLLVWYSGHGAYHRESRTHLFTIDDRTVLRRDEVLAEMLRARARLTVLVSDCCATITRRPPPPRSFAPKSKPEKEPRRPLAELLLGHRGVVDINSCAPGQAALGRVNEPALFTITFAAEVRAEFGKTEGFLTWQAFFRRVQAGTSQRLGELRRAAPDEVGDAQQTPHAFTPLSQVRASRAPDARPTPKKSDG